MSRNLEKGECTKCHAETFKLCYVRTKSKGDQLVCVDCFRKLSEKRTPAPKGE